jgi:integrase
MNEIETWMMRLADNSRYRVEYALTLFAAYLTARTETSDDLRSEMGGWASIDRDKVQGFVDWLLGKGYAIGTVNLHLCTVRHCCGLAADAGVLGEQDMALIARVRGISSKQGKVIDRVRPVCRVGTKKRESVRISFAQARVLKRQPDTPQGRRDALMMCLLLDHGLRVSELSALTVNDLDIAARTLRICRRKTDSRGLQTLTPDALAAATAYVQAGDAPPCGLLLRCSLKSGELAKGGLSVRAISARVHDLALELGIEGFSAHDCRHYSIRRDVADGMLERDVRFKYGWRSPASIAYYLGGMD